jgi:hypothetical protein
MEAFGNVDRLLASHGVSHKKCLVRIDAGLELLKLAHQLFINLKPAGCVNDSHISALALCGSNTFSRDFDWISR